MSTAMVHCISCGAEATGTDGKAQCSSCGQEFEYTMVARVQEVLPYQNTRDQFLGSTKLDVYCRASLYVSLVSCVFPLIAVISIGLAITGLFRIRRSRERGMAHAFPAIVVSLIGGLVFFRVWLGVNGAKAAALNLACAANLRQIGTGILMYEDDFRDAQGYGLSEILPHLGTPQTLHCPDRDPSPPAAGTAASSYILLTSLQPFSRIRAGAPSIAIAFEPIPHHVPASDGFPEATVHNVLFADGHVDGVAPADLPALIESSLLKRPSPERHSRPDPE